MLTAFGLSVLASLIGLAIRWWWTNHKRDKEIERLEAEKRGDIEIHAEMDKKRAEGVNPPSARDNADWL